ncbi:unnamed protein product [Schistosoma turkestanicum]|nr:unnamed protein product [Schistosoma turkestanicum]
MENRNEQISYLNGRFQCYSIDIYEDTTTNTISSINNNNNHTITEPEIDTTNHIDDDDDAVSNDDNDMNTESHPLLSMKYFLSKWSKKALIDQEFIEEDDNAGPDTFSDTLLTYITSKANQYGCEDIRYDWCGQPIFNGLPPQPLQPLAAELSINNDNQRENYSICHRCHAERVFELQLFATINNSLKFMPTELHNQEVDTVNVNWLLNIVTVLIFTCRNSCWSQTPSTADDDGDDWVEECVIVQTDQNVTKIIHPSS